MVTLVDLGTVNLPNGVRNFGPFARPASVVGFKAVFGRCTTATPTLWPNASTTVRIDWQYSYDGGVTYDPADNHAGPQAGGVIASHGAEIATWDVGSSVDPLPTHVKGFVTIAGGPCRTTLQVLGLELGE